MLIDGNEGHVDEHLLPMFPEPVSEILVADKVNHTAAQEKPIQDHSQSKKRAMEELKNSQYLSDSSVDDVGIPLRVRTAGTFTCNSGFSCVLVSFCT